MRACGLNATGGADLPALVPIYFAYGHDLSSYSKQEVALSVLERTNQTPVSPELFVEAMELFAEMPPEDRSVLDVRTLRLVDFLRAKGFSGRHHADLVVAITFRSFALTHLVQSDPVKGWISRRKSGA